MSHVKLLLKMVSPQRDDLEFWEVEEIKTETVTRITKLASDAYINQHQKEQHNTKTAGAQGPLVLPGAAPLLRPRMLGRYDLEPPPPPPSGVRNALTEDQALQMTATNAAAREVQQYKVWALQYYDPINNPTKKGTGMLALNPEDTDEWWERHKEQLPCLYAVYQHVTGAVVSSGQIERDFGVCGDSLPPKRNRTAPQYFQAQVSARVNFDALPTFECMPKHPMTEAAIRAQLPPADFGVSAICVGALVEREEQDVQEDMEEEGMEQVDDMGESDGMESSEEAVDLSGSSEGAADGFRGGRLRTPPLSHSR